MKNLRLWVLIVRGKNTTPQKADDGKDEMKPEHEKKRGCIDQIYICI